MNRSAGRCGTEKQIWEGELMNRRCGFIDLVLPRLEVAWVELLEEALEASRAFGITRLGLPETSLQHVYSL